MKRFFLLLAMVIGIMSCVPVRQFQDEKVRREKAEKEFDELRSQYDQLQAQHAELTEKVKTMEKQIAALERDTSITGTSLRKMTIQYDKVNQLYEELNRKYQELLSINASETQKISTELQLTQDQLNKKMEELKRLENELNEKQAYLNQLQQDLVTKEKRINELEDMLARKDKEVKELKEKVKAALKGFENNGLSIVERNGKLYVSMEESLLFASGSWNVNAKGREALAKLAKVLEENPDISIMVEGHTDNVPYKGSGQIKDNWDLSVMRATNVVKILLDNGNIDPKRITAAGRGEYLPLDPSNTSEARRKNRRTEIILTPKLDELLKILESN